MRNSIRLAAVSALACGALALAGCGKKDKIEAEHAKPEEVMNKVARSDLRFMPGRWESTMKIEKMEIPGLPPEAQAAMRQRMGAVQTFFTCLTKAEAEKPKTDFFQQNKDCTFDNFSMADGKIDAKMHCSNQGRTQTMTMSGHYGEKNYDITMESSGAEIGGKPTSMKMSVASKRVGECNGKEES
jgi:hypothetical protein